MPSGHTKTDDINQRHPITAGMRGTLADIADKPLSRRLMSAAEKNHARALMDRGLITWKAPGHYHVTDAGRAELERGK